MKTKLFFAAIAAISFAFVGCKEVKDNPVADPTVDFPEAVGYDANGAMPGVFSVGEKATVQFSRGNLQYLASSDTWRFANSQLAYVGSQNGKNTWLDLYAFGTSSWRTEVTKLNYQLKLDTLKETIITGHDEYVLHYDTIYNATTQETTYICDTVDHTLVYDTTYKVIRIDTLSAFYTLDTVSSKNYMPTSLTGATHYKTVHVDTLAADKKLPYFDYLVKQGVYVGNDSILSPSELIGDFAEADWGVHNAISNGGKSAGMWRTLTGDEFDYLLNKRPNAKDLAGIAAVANVYGIVILPDAWDNAKSFNAGFKGGFAATNTISAEDWQIFEQNGAIFLPCGGRRSGETIADVQKQGYYWTASAGKTKGASMVVLFKDGTSIIDTDTSNGAAVRLVKDVK